MGKDSLFSSARPHFVWKLHLDLLWSVEHYLRVRSSQRWQSKDMGRT